MAIFQEKRRSVLSGLLYWILLSFGIALLLSVVVLASQANPAKEARGAVTQEAVLDFAHKFWILFFYNFLASAWISGPALLAIRYSYVKLRHRSFGYAALRVVPASLFLAILAAVVFGGILFWLSSMQLSPPGLQRKGLWEVLLPLILISSIFTLSLSLLGLRYEYLQGMLSSSSEKKERPKPTKGRNSIGTPFLSGKENKKYFKSYVETSALGIRRDGEYLLLPYTDILYLASHGKKTLVYTKSGEYLCSELLKDILRRLPNDFLRIHKSYAVQLGYVKKIQYFMGGAYVLWLRDAEDTQLPVGRSYAKALKERLGIS